MLTTVPCTLSFATGCRPVSTSWTLPWIFAAQPGNDTISTSAAIAPQLRFVMPMLSPREEVSAAIRLCSFLHSRREAGTGPNPTFRPPPPPPAFYPRPLPHAPTATGRHTTAPLAGRLHPPPPVV